MDMFQQVLIALSSGFVKTIELFALTLLGALPLGLIIAFGSMNRWQPFRFLLFGQTPPGAFGRRLAGFRPISALCNVLVWVVRGTPLMLQLIGFMYIPGIAGHNFWPAGDAGRMMATVVAFSLNYACYFSVIYRGGIQGVPVGQREAGEVLGMTKSQIFFKITLLQMVKRIVPPMSNEVITLVKDTSLARVIAIVEITKAGESFMKSAGITWPLFYTAVFYLAFVGILTILFHFIERKLSYFR